MKGGAPYVYQKYTQKNKTKNTSRYLQKTTSKSKLSATKAMYEGHD